jgi:hypothetical protein
MPDRKILTRSSILVRREQLEATPGGAVTPPHLQRFWSRPTVVVLR